tara:strand:+ start:55 stop:1170 length:1116 start_codon:yes stop_codon:yes gene_type:complete
MIKEKKIAYTKPSITDLEVNYACDAAKNGWGEKCYDYILKFEKKFKDHLDVKYAISTSSCTGALHMGLYALGVGPGDEVIMANTNWVATVSPVVLLGAMPVFVDILEDSWCIDPDKIESAITKNTKAIIAVHLYGNLCKMNELNKIGEKYNIPIVEDAAEAIGSKYYGKSAGTIGKFGTFSFHGTKTITTGEGGMFVTNDFDLYEKVYTLSNHGRSRNQKKQFWPDMIGFKYKMSNIQAAIGCAQLERIDELIRKKRDIFNMYKKHLKDLPLQFNSEDKFCVNGYWMPTIVFEEKLNINLDDILTNFSKQNIDARVFFWPLNHLPIPGRKANNDIFLSENIHKRALNLPSSFDIEEEDIIKIAKILRSFFN